MRIEKIDLYDHFGMTKPTDTARGTLTCIVHDNSPEINPTRVYPAMLVIPGGAYFMTSDREAEPVALNFLKEGYQTFILRYSVFPDRFPAPQVEAALAIRYIREECERYSVDPDKVAAIGFSAGGHLCGCLGTLSSIPEMQSVSDGTPLRPDAVVMSYPVVSSDPTYAHLGSFDNLCGEDDELRSRLSLEQYVTSDTAPTFLWHTFEDQVVPVANTLVYAEKLRAAGVPLEVHIYEKGWHGLSVCGALSDGLTVLNPITDTASQWLNAVFNWLKLRGFAINK